MKLIRYLEAVEKRLGTLSFSDSTKAELHSLSLYLKHQAGCDRDRRAKQGEITEAAVAYVRALYQASLQSSVNQPQEFWETLERFANHKLEIRIKPKFEAPAGSEKWDVKELFTYLISKCEKLNQDTNRDQCVSALKTLLSEANKIRFHREHKKNAQLWKANVFPYLDKFGLMNPFKPTAVLKGRLQFFLKGTF